MVDLNCRDVHFKILPTKSSTTNVDDSKKKVNGTNKVFEWCAVFKSCRKYKKMHTYIFINNKTERKN